jgi:hypothetical protein
MSLNNGVPSRTVIKRVKSSIISLQQEHGQSDGAVIAGAVAVINYFGKSPGTAAVTKAAVCSSQFLNQVYSAKLAETFENVSMYRFDRLSL